MSSRLSYRRYALAFSRPVRTGHGHWPRREGVILRLELADGSVGYGEAAPIPGFGMESVDAVEESCRQLSGVLPDERLDAAARDLPTLRVALEAARADLLVGRPLADAGSASASGRPTDFVPVAALLPAGRAALAVARDRAELGFRTFKWKVGVGEAQDEMALLDDLCAELPSGSRLRLDANGAWDRATAERWLTRCAERPVEFAEQPCFAPAGASQARAMQIEDLLMGLAEDYPTPIALDESIAGAASLARWVDRGWPGIFVVKPSLIPDSELQAALPAALAARVVFSSALETRVGACSALRRALAWPVHDRAVGFGVWPLFADSRFDGPFAAPFIRSSDVVRLNLEEAWTALA